MDGDGYDSLLFLFFSLEFWLVFYGMEASGYMVRSFIFMVSFYIASFPSLPHFQALSLSVIVTVIIYGALIYPQSLLIALICGVLLCYVRQC
jgi:hypothetical protein